MDQVRKLHRILNEEHRNVVTDKVPVALIGIKLDGKSAHVAREVERAALADDCRKADEYRRTFPCFREWSSHRQIGQRLVALEKTMRPRAARMNYALGNTLVIKVRDLVAQDEVFEQRWPAQACF